MSIFTSQDSRDYGGQNAAGAIEWIALFSAATIIAVFACLSVFAHLASKAASRVFARADIWFVFCWVRIPRQHLFLCFFFFPVFSADDRILAFNPQSSRNTPSS